MTIEDALHIKHWRIVDGCTWRRIAEKAALKWPERGYAYGNQIQGRDLCDQAEALVGGEGWN